MKGSIQPITRRATHNIVKVSAVGSTDDEIRSYMSNAYRNWEEPPSYVLLVGVVGTIPAHIYCSGTRTTATDLFYATVDGNVKWSIVHDRKDAAKTTYKGFNRSIRYAWGARRDRITHTNIEIHSLTKYGPMNRGDVISLGLERFRFNPSEAEWKMLSPVRAI